MLKRFFNIHVIVSDVVFENVVRIFKMFKIFKLIVNDVPISL